MIDLPPFVATAAIRRSDRLRRLGLPLLCLIVGFLLVVWGAVYGALQQQRADALAAEFRQNLNIARVLEEQTTRVLATTDQATQRVRDAVLAGQAVAEELPRFANETGLVPNILVQLSWVDADGRFQGSNLDPQGLKTGKVDLSEREHVRVHLRPDALPPDRRLRDREDLFISQPVLGKVSKRWTVQISRVVLSPEGKALGVVVASLDPGYFEGVFQRVSLGAGSSVTLIGADRVVRARIVGGKATGMGAQTGQQGIFAKGMPSSEGTLRAISGLDGVDRLVAWRQVQRYPLFITVSASVDDALADWRANRLAAWGLVLLFTASTVLGGWLVWRGLKALEARNEALRLSEAQANSANQAKSEFLAAISHELRTPLTSIRGFAELMELRASEPRFREMAGLIRKGAEHLNALLTEILDFARVDAGAMPLQLADEDLPGLLTGTADFFRIAALEKGLVLRIDLDPDLPPVYRCDGLRLKQILNNLLSNALKFTAEGEVTLIARVEGRCLLLAVRDTGPGIAAEAQGHIFERFRQADGQVSHSHGGTGLGLALARGLADLMGGTLTVASTPGEGATFTLSLPLAGVVAKAPQAAG